MTKLWSLVCLIVFTSCTTPTTAPKIVTPTKRAANEVQAPTPAQLKEMAQLRAFYQAQDWPKLQAGIKKFFQKPPAPSLAPEAWYMLGQSHYRTGVFAQAYQAFLSVLKSPVISNRESESAILAAQCAIKTNQPLDAISVLDWAAQEKRVSPDSVEANRLRIQSYQMLGKTADVISTASKLMSSPQIPNAEKESLKNQVVEIINNRLNSEDLETFRKTVDNPSLRYFAEFRLGMIALEQKDTSRARGLLAGVADLRPPHELTEKARKLIDQLDSRTKVVSNVIGVVLPLTGDQAPKGYRALHGIQHAFGLYSKTRSGFRLAVIDSEGNADVARRAVERLVLEDHVIGIIGGFLSKTAAIEASKAQEYGVPIILLAQKSGLTQIGDYVFRNALTSQSIVEQVVASAMAQGMKRFAVIYPNDPYGVEYTNIFWDEVRARGGQITAAQPYDPKETDFRGHVQRLVGTYYGEDRVEEYNALIKARKDKNPNKKAIAGRAEKDNIEDVLPPVIDFDGIFIPDSPRVIGLIAPMLAYNEVTNVRLLGTNIWNNSALLSRGEKNVENAIFADAFATNDRGFAGTEFFAGFKGVFDEEPGFFELQAYEAGSIFRQILAGGENTRIGLQQKLIHLQRFAGPLGSLNMSSTRDITRKLMPLTVRNGQIVPMESRLN